MNKIRPEKMSKEVRLLWETAELHDLSPRRIAPFVGVGFKTIYNWFDGQKPLDAQRAKILEGVQKIGAMYPQPVFEQLPSGGQVAAGWGDPAADLENPAIIEDKKFNELVRPVFYQLMGSCSEGEKKLVADNWMGFVEVLTLLKKHGIGVPRRKK